jgi:ribosomal protein S18 acetylase RimI-like enzyme
MESVTVVYTDSLSQQHKAAVVDGLNNYALKKKGVGKDNGSFSFVILDGNNKFLAGVTGYNYFGCCYIDLLCVDEDSRDKGYGSLLIKKVEDLGRKRNCLFMALNTMDFEARPFYEKHGYQVEFTREGFEQDSVQYYMRKAL